MAEPIPQTLIDRLRAIFAWFGWRAAVVHPMDEAALRFYGEARKFTSTPEIPMVILLEARVRELESAIEALGARVTMLDDPSRR
jgi:hypothetical protein